MKTIAILIISALVISGVSTANAEVYTWVDENGVRHYSNAPPVDAEETEIAFPEYQYDEAADKARTQKEEQELNALLKEIERENARESAAASSTEPGVQRNRKPTREELVAAEKERLEKKIEFLEKQPLEYFGSQRNKIVRLGYYHYRIRDLLEDPDKYFNQPASFEGNVKVNEPGHESGGAGY